MVPHVIIVGGGFGGLSAARALRRAAVRVTLIDKRNYHLFRPMLYQVATGLLSDDEISGPLRSILSHQENSDVLLDEVMGISPKQRLVHLKHRDLAYDFLILATGIHYNYLSVSDHPEIFVIGDTAHLVAPVRNLFGIKSRSPMLMPGVAQPAIQEGKYVGNVIRRRVERRPQPEPFWYLDKGDLAIVGRTYAVADLRFVRFAGFAGWVLWAGVHIYFLIGFANRLFVVQWGFDFLTKRRRVRVLPEEPASAQNLIDPAA